jgi:hypothetical protein
MNERSRFYVLMAVAVAASLVLGRVGDDWSKLEFYAAGAVVIALGSSFGLIWVNLAPDGDLRRPRRPRRPHG